MPSVPPYSSWTIAKCFFSFAASACTHRLPAEIHIHAEDLNQQTLLLAFPVLETRKQKKFRMKDTNNIIKIAFVDRITAKLIL